MLTISRRDSGLKLNDRVRLNVPENQRLHGRSGTVLELYEWGAVLKTSAAVTGQFRAGWEEMIPLNGLNEVAGYTGDVCDTCGGSHMVRAGACLCCQDCGTSGGCG